MTDRFTFTDVRRDLIAPAGLDARLAAWQRNRDPALVRWVLGFEHRTLPGITPDDVRAALARSSHALGDLSKAVDTARVINDANPPWALAYLFHACLEGQGRVPTWGEFFAYVTGPAERQWWAPVRRAAHGRGIDSLHAYTAATWRLATAWQSAIRTVHTLSTLRHEHELPVRYHLLAHVELRVEGWLGQHAYRLVMPSTYEQRKRDPRTILGGRFTLHDITVTGYGRGHVYLPSDTALARLARELRADTAEQTLRLLG